MSHVSLLLLVLIGAHAAIPSPPVSAQLFGPLFPTICQEAFIMDVDLTTGVVVNRTIPSPPCILLNPLAFFPLDGCRRVVVINFNNSMTFNLTTINTCGLDLVVESSIMVPNNLQNEYVWENAAYDGNGTAYVPVELGIAAVNITSGVVWDRLDYQPDLGLGPVALDPVHQMLYLVRPFAPNPPNEHDGCSPICVHLDVLRYRPLRVVKVNQYIGRRGDPTSIFFYTSIGMFFDTRLNAIVAIGGYSNALVSQVLDLTTLQTLPYDSFPLLELPSIEFPGEYNMVAYDASSGWAVFCARTNNGPSQMCIRYRPISHTTLYSKPTTQPVYEYAGLPATKFS